TTFDNNSSAIDRMPILALEAIFAIPDLEGRFLEGDEAGASFTLQHRVGFSHFQSTLYECINVMTVVENTTNSTIKKKQHNI
ncbi:hypothetical protein ACE1BJ_12845, partial [Aeromonas jandaei]